VLERPPVAPRIDSPPSVSQPQPRLTSVRVPRVCTWGAEAPTESWLGGSNSLSRSLDPSGHVQSGPFEGLGETGSRGVHRLTWLMLPLLAANGLSAQKPQDTELLLDALPADSVRCGGLTFQFAKFAKDMGHHPIAGQTIEGSEKTAQGTGHGRGANMAPVRFCPVCPEGVGSSSRTTTSIWITALPCTAARPSSASSTRSELCDWKAL